MIWGIPILDVFSVMANEKNNPLVDPKVKTPGQFTVASGCLSAAHQSRVRGFEAVHCILAAICPKMIWRRTNLASFSQSIRTTA